jgi:hypothetical protein
VLEHLHRTDRRSTEPSSRADVAAPQRRASFGAGTDFCRIPVHGQVLGPAEAGAADAGAAPVVRGPGPGITSRTRQTALDAPDTRGKVGIGETVFFTAGAAADWSVSAGTAMTPSTGVPTLTWRAPAQAGGVTVVARQAGQGVAATRTMSVIAPAAIEMTNVQDVEIPAGTAGAGMILAAHFPPDDVVFGGVEWREESGPPTRAVGYFAGHAQDPDLFHHARTDFVAIPSTNRRNPGDHAESRGFQSPYSPGSIAWRIPNTFRVIGTNDVNTTLTTTQTTAITANGTVTVTKQGARVTRPLSGPATPLRP